MPIEQSTCTVKAHKLTNRAAIMRPAAPAEQVGDAASNRATPAAGDIGWVVCCPHAFEATWNGGPNPADIDIRLAAPDDDAPAFVQSNQGGGRLTFYTGYQIQTERATSLWVRGPINRPKDGLYPLEQIVDTSLLPGTITVNWTFTRPHQTVRFEAGEPFGVLLPYPHHYTDQFELHLIRPNDAAETYEREIRQRMQAPAMQAIFQRLQQGEHGSGMKVLLIQENGRYERNRHFRECFALQAAFQRFGWQADVWGLGHPEFPNLAGATAGGSTPVDFTAYDVIFNLENYDEIGWVPSLKDVKAYKILWAIDGHFRGMAPYREVYLRDGYDMMLQSTRDFIVEEEDARVRKNSEWFPNCFNDALIYPLAIDKKYDLGFCGNVVNREPYLSYLETAFQLKRDIFVLGLDMVKAINSYKIHFNKNIANDINYRNFETLGCKTLLLTSANPHYEDLGFVDGENCLIYHNLPELRHKIQWALSHPQQRACIAAKGYQLSKLHTYTERVKSLIALLERKV